MADSPARLLVSLRPREALTRAIPERLPGIPWAYSTGTAPAAWGAVEALLFGALERELPEYDPATTPRLAFAQRIYAGVDDVDFGRFADPVLVAGNVGAYAPFVAEHAVALALAAGHDLIASHARVREGHLRPPPEHRLLLHRTAVVLGYGAIGRDIARRLRGFDMRVTGVSRRGRMAAECDAMFPESEIRAAVAGAEFVFDARPLTRRTRGSVNAELLAAMPPHAVYVNVGRAGTVDEEALYRHLEANPGFRAALDVWWDEDFRAGTLRTRFPFAELPNFVGTPHSAGFGPGVERYVLAMALENLARFFAGAEPRHRVDRSEYSRSAPRAP